MSGISGRTLAQEEQASENLEKVNFDLKMQVHNLQEQLRKAMNRTGGDTGTNSGGGNETALKIEIQEKNIELNERNILLAKAKTAITDMKKELERIRKEHDPAIKAELEARVAKLKRSNEEIEAECRLQVTTMEKEIVALREKGFLQQEATAKAETRLEQVELNLSHAEQRLAESREDKAKLEEQWLLLQQKAGHMEEEITQARAHVELYRMEAQEAIDERDALRSDLAVARDMTHVSDQLNAQRVELETRHTDSMDRIATAHEKEMHRHKLEAERALEEVKQHLTHEKNLREKGKEEHGQKHEFEMARAREEHQKLKDEMRAERQREREEAAARVDEKTNEIKSLHMQVEAARSKAEHHLKDAEAARVDLETVKVELSFRTDQVDQYKNENQELHAEVKTLKRSHEQAAELREALRRTENEKESSATRFAEEKEELQHRLDHSVETLEALRSSFHEKESRAKLAEAELSAIKASHSTVETISRDNEKFKAEVQRLTHDLLKTTHDASDLKRDKEHLTNALAERERKLELHAGQITHLERENASLQATTAELNDILRADRDKHSGMDTVMTELHRQTDSSITEHKEQAAAYKHQIDGLEARLLLLEKERISLQAKHTTTRHDYIVTMQSSIENLENWDEVMTDLVEGIDDALSAGGGDRHGHGRSHALLSDTTQSITRALSQKGFLNRGAHQSLGDDDIAEHLTPAITALTERIKLKVRRAVKMRSHLSAMMSKQVSAVLSKFENADQRVQLLTLRLNEAAASVARANSMLDRDRRAAVQEATEARTFREETLSRLKDNAAQDERRAHEVASHLGKINDLQRELDASQRANEALARELRQRESAIGDLRAEVDAYGQAELVVKELSDRLQDLAAGRDQIAAELDVSNARVTDLERSAEAAREEYEALAADRGHAAERCEHFENLSESLQQQLRAAMENVESLRASQITPELAQMIRDTQSIVRATKEDSREAFRQEASGSVDRSPAVSAYASPGAVHYSAASSSSSSREQRMPSSPQPLSLPPAPTVRTPLGAMLGPHVTTAAEAGSALSKAGLQYAPNSAGGAARPINRVGAYAGSHASGSSGSGTPGSSAAAAVSFASGRGLPVPAPAQLSPRNAAANQWRGQHTPTQAAQSHTPTPSPYPQSYVRASPNFSTGTPQRDMRLPVQGAASASSGTPGSGGTLQATALRTPVGMGAVGASRPASSSASSSASTPTTHLALTPNTQSRPSVSRLHKLGSDIEALARQLDGFDAADRNRWR